MADWLSTGASILGGAVGAIFGPVGVAAGSALGSAAGAAVNEWLSSPEDGPAVPPVQTPAADWAAWQAGRPGEVAGAPPWQTTGTGLEQAFGGGASGGGGAGSSWTQTPGVPAIPQYPNGGLTGPVYGVQALPPAAQTALSTVLAAMRAYPYISDFVQRFWDFPTEKIVDTPKSQQLWTAIAAQLPKTHREALEQFLVGFPNTVGLSKASEDIFLTLKVAESGYTPQQLCCVKGA